MQELELLDAGWNTGFLKEVEMDTKLVSIKNFLVERAKVCSYLCLTCFPQTRFLKDKEIQQLLKALHEDGHNVTLEIKFNKRFFFFKRIDNLKGYDPLKKEDIAESSSKQQINSTIKTYFRKLFRRKK